MTLKTPKMIFHFPLMAFALFTSTSLASATTCDRACLLEQAKQFNANVLAHTPQKIPLAPTYQVPFAQKIKKEAGILTGAVGLITGATEAEKILREEQADLIILARQFLRDPYFPLHAAKELGDDVVWPVQYDRAKR